MSRSEDSRALHNYTDFFVKAVRATHVNLVDLVDSPTTGEPVRIFQSVQQLSVYTKQNGKFFPMENAYAGGILRYLLRQIMSPPDETRRRGGAGRGRGRGGRGRGRGGFLST